MRHSCGSERHVALILSIMLLCTWSSSRSLADDSVEKPTLVERVMNFSFLPFVIYTPETRFGGGIGGIHTFHFGDHKPQSRPNSVSLSAKYTQNRQYAIQLTPRFYLKDQKYYLWSDILYQKSPFKFYGLGNKSPDDMEEDYTPKEIRIWANLRRKVYSVLRFGIQYNFEDTNIVEVEEGRLLASGDIPGGGGGRSSGVGVILDWDSRDREFSATAGGLYQASAMIYGGSLGSDFDFTRYLLDLRYYLPILPSHTLALNGFFEFSTGEPPFQKLALLGGRFRMRGYYEGRHRDRNMISFQAEYRVVPVWWRFGVVGFAAVGDVSRDVSDFRLSEFKFSGGFGFRYQFNPDEGVNLRADFAFGEGTSGYYLTVLEAF